MLSAARGCHRGPAIWRGLAHRAAGKEFFPAGAGGWMSKGLFAQALGRATKSSVRHLVDVSLPRTELSIPGLLHHRAGRGQLEPEPL
jgi:hypothetical protein